MKTKLFLTAVLATMICFNASAQNTTEEEYNWMTKGYKTMVASGLDMKKGYYFDDGAEFSKGWSAYKFTFKLLKRVKDKTIAGTLVIATSNSSGNTYYYCIPALDYDGENYTTSSYMGSFYKSAWELDGTMTDCFFASLAMYFSVNSTYLYSGK